MRTPFPLLTLVFVGMATAGCVRTDTEMLDASTAVVSARGTAFDTPATVLKTTVMEIAKLGQAHGFAYFMIVSAKDATRTATMYQPGASFTSGSVTGSVSDLGNTGYFRGNYSATTTSTPGWTQTFVKPGSDVVVRFFHQGEVDAHADGMWSVADVIANGDSPAGHSMEPTAVMTTPSVAPAQSAPIAAISAPPPAQRFDDWSKKQVKQP